MLITGYPGRSRLLRQCQGYSLLELLGFVLVSAIVLGVSIPALDSVSTAIKLRSTTSALVETLQMAKMKAVNENTSITVNLSFADRSFQIPGLDTTYLDRTISFSGSLPESLTFTSRGRLSSSGDQTITLQSTNGTTVVVVVNSYGRISVS